MTIFHKHRAGRRFVIIEATCGIAIPVGDNFFKGLVSKDHQITTRPVASLGVTATNIVTVSRCEDQGSSRVYTDKLTIEISDGGGARGGCGEDQQQPTSGSFDPDTLERNLDRDRRQQARPGEGIHYSTVHYSTLQYSTVQYSI